VSDWCVTGTVRAFASVFCKVETLATISGSVKKC
jgi:hypothetical protein